MSWYFSRVDENGRRWNWGKAQVWAVHESRVNLFDRLSDWVAIAKEEHLRSLADAEFERRRAAQST
jgi:hypothetical protein